MRLPVLGPLGSGVDDDDGGGVGVGAAVGPVGAAGASFAEEAGEEETHVLWTVFLC